MRKGIDWTLFREVKVDNRTGKVVSDKMVWRRPAHAVKVLAERHATKKRKKQARKKQYLLAAVERRHRQRRSARA